MVCDANRVYVWTIRDDGREVVKKRRAKVCLRSRACTHMRPRHRCGVGERPDVRRSVERTACLGVGLNTVHAVDQSGGSIRPPFYAVSACNVEWPLSDTVFLTRYF